MLSQRGIGFLIMNAIGLHDVEKNQLVIASVGNRSEPIAAQQWLVYLAAGLGLAALLWYAAIRRYHQESLAVSA